MLKSWKYRAVLPPPPKFGSCGHTEDLLSKALLQCKSTGLLKITNFDSKRGLTWVYINTSCTGTWWEQLQFCIAAQFYDDPPFFPKLFDNVASATCDIKPSTVLQYL